MHRPVTDADLVVRAATRRDLRTMARLHRTHLPGGFFARLGRGFLRAYHATFLASPLAVALVVTDPAGTSPAGFLVGTLRNRAHYRWVLRRAGPTLAVRFAAALGCRPRLAWLFLRTRVGRYLRWLGRYPLQRWGNRAGATPASASPPTETGARPVAVLTHVVVDEALRGRGAGRRLVDAFVDAARQAGAAEARLVTDVDGGAARFYEQLGWAAVEDRSGADGVVVREFVLPLEEA
jgi:ribosomal protein S18 acetylase RimI-like enzyme